MLLSEAKSAVAAILGVNSADTDINSHLGVWLNQSYRDIIGRHRWSWLRSTERVTMDTDYTTGTVNATAASATITFSATITASQTGRYIQFSSAKDWYYISAHTAGTDTATISPAYIQTTNLTAGTFTIRTFYYSLSSSTDFAFSARQAASPVNLRFIDTTQYDERVPFTDATGDPQAVIFWGYDSSNCWQFTPYPFPDEPVILEFRTIKRVAATLVDADTPIFPDRFTGIWLDGAKAYGYEFLDDDREDKAHKRFDEKLKAEVGNDNPALMVDRVLQAADQQVPRRNFIPFPPQFGDMK